MYVYGPGMYGYICTKTKARQPHSCAVYAWRALFFADVLAQLTQHSATAYQSGRPVAPAHSPKLRHHVAHVFNCLHLLFQKVTLNEVSHLRVAALVCGSMERQQLLIHELLHRQRQLHSVERIAADGSSKLHVRHHNGLQ